MTNLSRFRQNQIIGFGGLIIFLFCLLSRPDVVKAQACPAIGTCLGGCQYLPIALKYRYDKQNCTGILGKLGFCDYNYAKIAPTLAYSLPQNTNHTGDWECINFPSGCEQGFYCPGGPTATPGGGGGGSCKDHNAILTDPCPVPYRGDKCDRIPCGYLDECGCTGFGCCAGGGGASPTPTPQPTPFCRLFCPGQEALRSQMNQYTGSGVNNILLQPTPVLPTQAVGFLDFFGYNKFPCSSFDDGKTGAKACPDDEERGDYGLLGGFGLTSHWIYPTPTTSPIRYNMLCGGQAQTYTAVATSGERSGQQQGNGFGPSSTPGPSPTSSPYPEGCVLNGAPTPTIGAGSSTQGDQSAGGAQTQGGVFMGGDPNSCSCSVKVGCQSELQTIVESGCGDSCNFSISPDNPVYNTPITFGITGTPSQIDFDDNTAPLSNPSGSVSHTFLNAGVYRVTATCGAKSCQKTMNSYCFFIPKLWYKLKDASMAKRVDLVNPLPATVLPYDGDDTGERMMVIGDGGVVLSEATVNTGTAATSTRDWKRENYSLSAPHMTPTLFVDYVKSRKQYVTVNAAGTITGSDLTSDTINIASGDFILDSPSLQSKAPFVLVVIGNATVTGNINPPAKSLVVMATGTIKVTSAVTEMNGIFIGNSVDFASDIGIGQTTPNTLKISGNIISLANTDTNKRQGADIKKPSLFIILKPEMYLDLLPMLSVRKYEWKE